MKNRGYIYLIGAALSWAAMGILVKFLSHELNPFSQTFLRLIVSAILTFILVKIKGLPLKLKSTSDFPLAILMGIFGYGISIIAFTFAFYYTSIGNVLFIMYLYPIVAAIVAHFVLKEKLHSTYWIAAIILTIGLLFIFNPSNLIQGLNGNILALISGLTFVIYIIGSRILSKRGNTPETITLWSVCLAVITAGFGAIFFEGITLRISPEAWLGVILFGFLNFLGWNLVNKGFKYVKASTGSVILILEPIVGTLLGIIFFKEIPTPLFLLGAIFVILSIYISTRVYDTPEVQ